MVKSNNNFIKIGERWFKKSEVTSVGNGTQYTEVSLSNVEYPYKVTQISRRDLEETIAILNESYLPDPMDSIISNG